MVFIEVVVKIEKIANDNYPYCIRFDNNCGLDQWQEMYEWAGETFGKTYHPTDAHATNWTLQWAGIRFKTKEHATWFILRFSGIDN